MRTLLVGVLSMVHFVTGAAADTVTVDKVAVKGRRIVLAAPYQLNSDCTLVEWGEIRITQPAEKGKTDTALSSVAVWYPKENTFSRCNGKTIQTKIIHYTAAKDASGEDKVVFEYITSLGQERIWTVNINIK